jgi:hypothetical protein
MRGMANDRVFRLRDFDAQNQEFPDRHFSVIPLE